MLIIIKYNVLYLRWSTHYHHISPSRKFQQRLKFSYKITINKFHSMSFSLNHLVFFPCPCSNLLVENVGLFNFLLGDGDGVSSDDNGISPGEIRIVCKFSFSSTFLTECFSGLPKKCVCRLLLPDDLELFDTCESLSPSPFVFSLFFSGFLLSDGLISSVVSEVVPIFPSVFPSLFC